VGELISVHVIPRPHAEVERVLPVNGRTGYSSDEQSQLPGGARGVEVLLVHPGGPFWARRDLGVWSIPKGLPNEGEDLLDAARREFNEETGFVAGEGAVTL